MTATAQDAEAATFQGFPLSGSMLCPQCDYDLTGLPNEHACPECGLAFDGRTRVWAMTESRRMRRITFSGFGFAATINLALTIHGILGGSSVWVLNLAAFLLMVFFFIFFATRSNKFFFSTTPMGLIAGTRQKRRTLRRIVLWQDADIPKDDPGEWRRKYWSIRVGKMMHLHLPSLAERREEQLELLQYLRTVRAHYAELLAERVTDDSGI